MKEIVGSSVLLLGYGREGQSTHKYIRSKYPDKSIGIADKNPGIKPLFEAERVYVGEEYLAHLSEFDVIVRSPGIPANTPELKQAVVDGKKVTSETNIFFSECPAIVVGVTGTKGKSTTSSLIASILGEQYDDVRLVGNIGKPALDQLPNTTKDSIFVMELSSYQLEDIRFSPQYAVMLGIKQEHLDHHGSFDAYIQAKKKIVEYQGEEEYVIFNSNNDVNRSLLEHTESKKVTFATDDHSKAATNVRDGKIYYKSESFVSSGEIEIMDISEIPLLGKGNLENVLAAVTVGMLFGVPPDLIKKAVKEFKTLDHRLQYVGEKNGIRFYDDSLATIPEATINAMEAFGEDVETLIAGGYDRGIDFSKLGAYLSKRKGLKTLILFPTTGEHIWKAILDASTENESLPTKYNVKSMEEAVGIAFDNTSAGKTCLLSPASASFGLFKDYADRGDRFKNAVKNY